MFIVCVYVFKKYFLNECKFSEEESYLFRNICVGLRDGEESEGSMLFKYFIFCKDFVNIGILNIKFKVWLSLEIRI